MPSPYGLDLIESCLTCPHHRDRLFCDLSPEALKHLAEITSASSYPKGAFLFMEGRIHGGFSSSVLAELNSLALQVLARP